MQIQRSESWTPATKMSLFPPSARSIRKSTKATSAKVQKANSMKSHQESGFSKHLPGLPSLLITTLRDLMLVTAGKLLYPVR
jgi:hypothetical protein